MLPLDRRLRVLEPDEVLGLDCLQKGVDGFPPPSVVLMVPRREQDGPSLAREVFQDLPRLLLAPDGWHGDIARQEEDVEVGRELQVLEHGEGMVVELGVEV